MTPEELAENRRRLAMCNCFEDGNSIMFIAMQLLEELERNQAALPKIVWKLVTDVSKRDGAYLEKLCWQAKVGSFTISIWKVFNGVVRIVYVFECNNRQVLSGIVNDPEVARDYEKVKKLCEEDYLKFVGLQDV